MQIQHYHFDKGNFDTKLFNKLHDLNLCTRDGVLQDLYSEPELYTDEVYMSVMTHRRKPISVTVIGKDAFFGWDRHFPEIKEQSFGLIGFYTAQEHRNKGYAKQLFEAFDQTFKIRRLCVVRRAEGIISSLPETEKVFIDDGPR